MGDIKDKKINQIGKIRVKRQSQKLQEVQNYNAASTSIATINIEGDHNNMVDGQFIGGNLNKQMKIKT